jgi:hypothetical protein
MDLKNPKWMYLKAILFILIGFFCFLLVILEHPAYSTAAYLIIMIWAFSRAYYFAFYVIEKYVDSEYKFSGLMSFLRYLMKKRK